MKKLALHWKIIIGLIAGIIWALLSAQLGWSKFTIDWIAPWGDIFINLLKLIAVPLVLFSIISGVSGLSDTSSIGRMGGKTLLTYLVTTVIAVSVGLLLVNLINPGKTLDDDSRLDNRIAYELWAQENDKEVKDAQCYSCLEENAERVEKVALQMKTEVMDEETKKKVEKAQAEAKKTKESGPLQSVVDMVPSNIFFSLNNNGLMLQVIFFAIFFGICLLFIPKEQALPVIKFIDGINEVFLKMVDFTMRAAPFFVFALLAGVVSKMAGDDIGKVGEIFKGLSVYSLVVALGLVFMVFVFYPMFIALFVKKMSFKKFLKGISPAQILAFSTSSSAATLPVTMECVEDNLGVDEKVTSFVLPIGATVNMDGTSLYQAVAVIFLAQMHMIDLTLGQQLTIVFTATLASIGSAAVPSAGLVMLIIVLESVDLNPAWIAIIFPVDRILDMMRTVVNVTGDATVSTFIANTEGLLNDVDVIVVEKEIV